MRKLDYFTIIVILASAASILLQQLIKMQEYGNILATALGVVIDILLFTCLFSWVKGYFDNKKRASLNASLATCLAGFIKDYVFWITAGAIDSINELTEQNSNKVKTLRGLAETGLKALEAGNSIPEGMCHPIKWYGKREAPILGAMLPIAIQVSQKHFECWYNIIKMLQAISADDSGEIEPYAKNLLNYVKEFDSLLPTTK